MSRNLCRHNCAYCESDVRLDEEPRFATAEDCGRYFSEYATLIVARATCPLCEAKAREAERWYEVICDECTGRVCR
jgi:hypothetical protein